MTEEKPPLDDNYKSLLKRFFEEEILFNKLLGIRVDEMEYDIADIWVSDQRVALEVDTATPHHEP